MVFRIFLMRHSKSCSNLMRDHGMMEESQGIRDPGLTVHGIQAARSYGPILRRILQKNGFPLDKTTVGSSALFRANETARFLFPSHTVHTFPYLTEHGDLPENIPRSQLKTTANTKGWSHFVAWLHENKEKFPADEKGIRYVVAVGHRTYLRREVLEPLSKITDIENMDGCILEIDKAPRFIKYVRYNKPIAVEKDRCVLNMNTSSRMKRSTVKHTVKHRGGGYGLPQAYFQEGTQFIGTSPFETGVGLGASTPNWAREAIQVGGNQKGGFPAGVMGRFVVNGMSLIPIAGYMAYKQINRKTKAKTKTKTKKSNRRTKRR